MAITNIEISPNLPLREHSKIVELNPKGASAEETAAPKPVFYNGVDPDQFMAAMVKMMEAVQAAEAMITKVMAANSTLQKEMGDQFLQGIVAEGKAMIQKIEAEERAAEEAAKKSRIGGILGIVAAAVMAVATVFTCGLTAGLLAITMTVMMALPADKNPLQMGAKEFSHLTGSDFAGQVIMIAIVAVAIGAAGNGASLFFEEGAADGAAGDAAANGSSQVTKQSVAATTRSLVSDSILQTSIILNPLGTGAAWLGKKSGSKQSWVTPLLEAVAMAVTIIGGLLLTSGSANTGTGIELCSKETTATIRSLCHNLTAALAISSGGFTIAAGVAEKNQADALEEQAGAQGSYTLFNGLMKNLQGNIQTDNKQQESTIREFQMIGKNFAHLADPYKYMANASGVLA